MDSSTVKSSHSIGNRSTQQTKIAVHLNTFANEMFRAILQRVPAHQLVHLRPVSHRWKDVIESVCRKKKRLVILRDWKTDYFSQLCARFNGHLKLNKNNKLNFAFIRLRYIERFAPRAITLTGDICTLLTDLFPRIEQLYIIGAFLYSTVDFNEMLQKWSPSLSTLSLRVNPGTSLDDFCARINQLKSLKRLDLQTFPTGKAEKLAPTLGRLEHLSGGDFPPIAEIVPHLGDGFCSLGLYTVYSAFTRSVSVAELTRWLALYPQSVSSLTRFSFHINYTAHLAFVCEHFASLRVLCTYGYCCQLTTKMLENLARLRHLEEIRFDHTRIDVDFDGQIALYKIRTVSLVDFLFCKRGRNYPNILKSLPASFDGHEFAQVLAEIFPYVSKLNLQSEKYPELASLLRPHVNLFVNLHSHNFGLTDSIDRFDGLVQGHLQYLTN